MLAPYAEQVRVIPNGVDLETFKPSDRSKARQDLGLPQDAWILLMVASYIHINMYKDYPTLLQTAALLREKFQGKKIIVLTVGDSGPEKVQSSPIQHVPFTKDPLMLAKYYQAADVYVHSAKADTFPTTILEALACGIPVAASNVGGIPEQVRSMKFESHSGDSNPTGILAAPQQPTALAEAISLLLENDSMRLQLGSAAASDARARFNFKTQVDAYLSWYEEILTKRKARIA